MARSNSPLTEIPSLNRREFLYYALGGSIVLAAGGAAAGLLRYVTPDLQKIDPTRFITLSADDLPNPYSASLYGYNRFYIARDINLIGIFDIHCTYKGCLVNWVDTNYRFECPCCGAKFEINGAIIEGPAHRSLDRYFIEITFADGSTTTSNDAGDLIPLAGREIASVTIDTRLLIPGPARKINFLET